MGMQTEKFDELENRTVRIITGTEKFAAQMDFVKQMEARALVSDQIEAMKAEGKALELSDEEIKLLEGFRRFKLRMRRDQEIFQWIADRPAGVEAAADTAEIVTPAEALPIPYKTGTMDEVMRFERRDGHKALHFNPRIREFETHDPHPVNKG
jgi:hypothetical protein